MWTEEDAEYALAWQELSRDECSGCGQPKSESFDPDSTYEVRHLKCFACEARDLAGKEFQDGKPPGLYFATIKDRGGL